MGPNILLKESLSMQTTRVGVMHLTLACLEVFRTRAISPKQSPQLNSNTFLDCFSATSFPSATMQNLFPSSPSLTTQSPALQFYSFKISQSCSFSYGSISERIETFERIVLNFYLLLLAASSIMCLNVCLSSPQRVPCFEHLIEAALGAVYMRASSPKHYPVLQVFKYTYFPWMILEHSYSPEPTTYKVRPYYPQVITLDPDPKLSIDIASITMFMSSSVKVPNNTDFLSKSRMHYLT